MWERTADLYGVTATRRHPGLVFARSAEHVGKARDADRSFAVAACIGRGDAVLAAYEALRVLKDGHLQIVVAVAVAGGVGVSATPGEPRHRTTHLWGQCGAFCTC